MGFFFASQRFFNSMFYALSSIATEKCLPFVPKSLADNAPRIKWESAKVMGNIAALFLSKLIGAIKELLIN